MLANGEPQMSSALLTLELEVKANSFLMCVFLGGGDIPFYPGQEPDPTSGRRECQAELHRFGW